MPISLEPQEKRLFWLDSDASKPIESRPVFECRAPTRRIMREYSVLKAEVTAADKLFIAASDTDPVKAAEIRNGQFDTLLKMALLGVSGWKNFGEFTVKPVADAIDDALSNEELRELAYTWPVVFELTGDDVKNSPSPSQSEPATSAGNASAENATTNPAPNTPSGLPTSPAASAATTPASVPPAPSVAAAA